MFNLNYLRAKLYESNNKEWSMKVMNNILKLVSRIYPRDSEMVEDLWGFLLDKYLLLIQRGIKEEKVLVHFIYRSFAEFFSVNSKKSKFFSSYHLDSQADTCYEDDEETVHFHRLNSAVVLKQTEYLRNYEDKSDIVFFIGKLYNSCSDREKCVLDSLYDVIIGNPKVSGRTKVKEWDGKKFKLRNEYFETAWDKKLKNKMKYGTFQRVKNSIRLRADKLRKKYYISLS